MNRTWGGLISLLAIFMVFLFFYENKTRIRNSGANYEDKTSVSHDASHDWVNQITMPKVDFTPDQQLVIVTMNNYIPSDVFDHFTKTYGTEIVSSQVTSNEELFELLKKFPGKYDVLTTGNYMVTKMINEGMLHKLHHEKIPNMANLDTDVTRSMYDRGLTYSVPLFRASLGIVFNINYVNGIPRDLAFIGDHIHNDYLAFRIGVIKEMRFAMGLSLMSLGYSPNTIRPSEIIEARDRLIKMIEKYGLILMSEVNDDEFLITNDILLGLHWNGTAAKALLKNPDINFLLPEGQVLVTIDSAVISAKSKRINTAELFINYLLMPQVAARMSNYNCFSNCVNASMPFVRRIIRNGPGFIFPEEPDRLFLQDLGEGSKLYEDAWTQVMDAKPSANLIKLPLPKGGLFQGETQSSDFDDRFEDDMKIEKSDRP